MKVTVNMYVLPSLQEKCNLGFTNRNIFAKANIIIHSTNLLLETIPNAHATSLYGYDGFMKHVANSLKHVAWTHHTCTLKFHVSRNKVVWPFKPYTDFSGSNASLTGDRALLTNCGLYIC